MKDAELPHIRQATRNNL